MPTNADKQILREMALKYLAERSAKKFELAALYALLRLRGVYTESDLAEALAVLEGLGFVSKIKPRLGSIPEYTATAEGVIFHEQSDS